ncbi:protein TolR [Kiloniella sp.]|uniref:protein TolR n=1 Tax=Kiloniella sp. TaxID=1938587 RepID=UPI003A953CDB
MAAPTLGGGAAKGSGRWKRSSRKPMSDINVTPFVDVMLVLLIVFMVTAPLLTVGVPVDLPKAQAKTLNASEEPLVISVNATGELFLQETKLTEEQLVPRLNAITENKPDTRVYVRGDKAIDYGRVMQVMSLVNSAGYDRVALIAELPKENK